MIRKRNTIDSLKLIKKFFFGFTLLLSFTFCAKEKKEFDVKIDLAQELGVEMFSPDHGDSIFIAGNFNSWDNNAHVLKKSSRDWVYGIDVSDMVDLQNPEVQPNDTLEFKFYIKSDNPSKLLNTGWESIENRKYMIGDLLIDKPTFLYNDINKIEEKKEITFTVGMSNQNVLGFFEPDSGDIIVVTGSFLNWDPLGIPLKKVSNGVYSETIPISEDLKSIEYKYRILSKRDTFHSDQGWEKRSNRVYFLNSEEGNTNFTYFDDLKRVARFRIAAEELIKRGEFDPSQGNQIQIKLKLDGNEVLSNFLFPVKDFFYETAIVIPESVISIEWKLVKDLKNPLSDYITIEVPIEGKLVIN